MKHLVLGLLLLAASRAVAQAVPGPLNVALTVTENELILGWKDAYQLHNIWPHGDTEAGHLEGYFHGFPDPGADYIVTYDLRTVITGPADPSPIHVDIGGITGSITQPSGANNAIIVRKRHGLVHPDMDGHVSFSIDAVGSSWWWTHPKVKKIQFWLPGTQPPPTPEPTDQPAPNNGGGSDDPFGPNCPPHEPSHPDPGDGDPCETGLATNAGDPVDPEPNRTDGGHHVLLHSGQENLVETDHFIAGIEPALNLRINRRHLTRKSFETSALGPAWSFNYAHYLEHSGDGSMLHRGFGRTDRFVWSPEDQAWLGEDGRLDRIKYDSVAT